MRVGKVDLGGRLKHFSKEWGKLTSDPFVLDCIGGCKIDFTSIPCQTNLPSELKFNKEETEALQELIKEMESDKIVEKCVLEHGDYVSNVFLREKKDRDEEGKKKYRMILNLKKLNRHVKYVHFKMESLEDCLNLMEKDCYMGSIDIIVLTTISP